MVSLEEMTRHIALARQLGSPSMRVSIDQLEALVSIAISAQIADWMCGPTDEDELPIEWENLREALDQIDRSKLAS